MIFNKQLTYLWVQTAHLLIELFLYLYETDFIQGLLKNNEKKLARSFNFTFRYIDYVLSLNNSMFGDFVDRIYPVELEIKNTTDSDRSASYFKSFSKINQNLVGSIYGRSSMQITHLILIC